MGQAEFAQIQCVDIKVKGNYVAQMSLDGSHFLEVSLVVEKTGTFNITAVPQDVGDEGNGYSYFMSGMALAKGPLTLKIPAQGCLKM